MYRCVWGSMRESGYELCWHKYVKVEDGVGLGKLCLLVVAQGRGEACGTCSSFHLSEQTQKKQHKPGQQKGASSTTPGDFFPLWKEEESGFPSP